jgi:hypothetical protein
MKQFLLSLTIFLVACSLVPKQNNPTMTLSIPTNTTEQPLEIKTPPQVSSESPTHTKMSEVDVAPINRVVPLTEQTLSVNTRLIMFDPKTKQMFSISNQYTNLVPIIELNGKMPDIKLSPDHKWIAYYYFDNGFQVGVKSVDGLEQSEGLKKAVGPSFQWISPNKIVAYDQEGLAGDCPNKLEVVNPYTGISSGIPPINSEGRKYCFPIPYFSDDLSQAIYYNNPKGWEIYNFKSQTSKPILPGFGSDLGYRLYWDTDGLSFAIPVDGGIEFSSKMTEDDLSATVLIEKVNLPLGTDFESPYAFFEYWIPDEQVVGFNLVGANDSNVLSCDIPKTFVSVDLKKGELSNYCLDRTEISGQHGTPSFTYISKDHRFVGWTVTKPPNNDEPIGTVVLDLQTGKVSYLEGLVFYGFGEIDT